MNHSHRSINVIFFITMLIFAACTAGDTIQLASTNFDQQIDQFQNLTFEFDRDLAPDTVLNNWDSANYIEFMPQVNGRFQWVDHRTLVFSPSVPFAPNSDYSYRITRLVSRFLPVKKNVEDKIRQLHTPYLTVDRSQAYWSIDDNDGNNVSLRILLHFNYAVDKAAAVKQIRFSTESSALAARLITTENGNDMEFAVASAELKTGEIKVVIAKGMSCPGSARLSDADETITLPVPAQDKLEITDITAEFENGEGIIQVYTTQPVQASDLKSMVKLDPALPFELQTQGNGFSIKGGFSDGQSYTVNISGTLRGVFGPELGNEFTQTVMFGSLQPYIAFTDQSAMYLTPSGQANLGLQVINVPKIKVTVFKVFENNIQHYMRMGKQWDWSYEDDEYHDIYTYSLDENYGELISAREIDTRSLPRKGNFRLLHLQPDELKISSDLKGIYLIRAEAPDRKWLADVQLVSVSDIGLLLKQGNGQILVAARSVYDAKPLQGVTIKFISKSNQQVAQVTTNCDGWASYTLPAGNTEAANITMISARKGSDFNVMLLNQNQVETSRFNVGGKHMSGQDYDVFVYGDRTLYRPGDSVFCNAVIRTPNWELPGRIPVKFRIISPDGKDFIIRRATVNAAGAAQLSFRLPETALTGIYMIELLSPTDVMLANYRISAEEFMPDRIKVEVKPDKTVYNSGQELSVTTNATNFFGPPAANRKTENELRITRRLFTAKGYDDFSFGINEPNPAEFETIRADGKTDLNGREVRRFSLPGFTDIGLLSGRLYTTVFDENGRPVNRYTEIEIQTQQQFLGLGPTDGWVGTGKPVTIALAALSRNGKPLQANGRIQVVNIRWETVLERNYGSTTYRSQRSEKIIENRAVQIPAAGGKFTFTPVKSGSYEIRLSLPDASTYVSRSFYAFSGGDAGLSSFQINREGEIGIESDKPVYAPGEKARLLFKTPFEGELMVTVEQEDVIENYPLHATADGASIDLKIKENFLPNVYISATLIRKTDLSGLPLTVAHGYTSLKVESDQRKLPLVISAPAKQRSGTKPRITVQTTPGAEVTIAAVDEGILQINNYNSPDPYTYFYAKRALGVKSYDLFKMLFPELSTKRSSSGGDQGFDIGKRMNPLTSKRVELLARWSGTRTANASGKVDFILDIPQFSGAVRIMVVAYQNNRFAGASKQIKIADPLVISSSLPRFVSPGDQVKVMVTLSNTTSKPLTVNLLAKSDYLLECKPFDKSRIEIPANNERSTEFILEANQAIGTANIIITATADGETYTEKTQLTVRPAVPLVKKASSGVVKGGSTLSISAPGGMMKGSGKSGLLITSSPAGKYAGQITELINYPYGCLEQTVSAAFPQLYYGQLAQQMFKSSRAGSSEIKENIQQAILKLEGMQQYNGGLTYWPDNASTVSWWGTAYAANFLTEAERAGYGINQTVLRNIIRYLTEMVKKKETTEYFYRNPSGTWQRKTQPVRETFYSLYVLALNGNQQLPTMNYYKARAGELSYDSRVMLACAYALCGDMRSYNNLITITSGSTDEPETMTGGCFSSPLRDKAIALYTLVTADPANQTTALLARQVGEMLKQKTWFSTQERAFALLALGKLAGQAGKTNITATISVGSKKITFNGTDINILLAENSASISTSGNGQLFYFMETEGLPLSMKTEAEDRVLKVRRKLYSPEGKPVNPEQINQNDLIVIALTVSVTDNIAVDNVAITDLLPSGFEIENPRLTAERELTWVADKTQADYMDIRDDRITYFTNATIKPKTFYYMVRAVNRGTFVQGAVAADAMYNGQYYSYSGAGKVIIR